jgi:hypothetical protein
MDTAEAVRRLREVANVIERGAPASVYTLGAAHLLPVNASRTVIISIALPECDKNMNLADGILRILHEPHNHYDVKHTAPLFEDLES